MVVKFPLDIDLKELLGFIEERAGVKLPRDITETYLDPGHDLLFTRFRGPRGVEVGEPLPLKTSTTLFTEEGTGEVTTLEVIGISDLLSELGINIIALEAAALDVGTKNELDNPLSAYDVFMRDYIQVRVGLGEVYSAFRYMASDVGGIAMATPALPIEEVLRRLRMGA